MIRTIVGTGDCGWFGDGGIAVAASLNEPKAVALDQQGNLIIADSENNVVRKVDRTTGMITTVAGIAEVVPAKVTLPVPTSDPVGDAHDPLSEMQTPDSHGFTSQTDLSGTVRYVTNRAGGVKRFDGDGGRADQARLNFPTAVVVDREGHVYIADTLNHRVRRIEADTGRITTIAGIGQPRYGGDGGPANVAGLNDPAALAMSGSGTLYVADQSNHRVRAIDMATGLIRTVAGIGFAGYNGDGIPATEAALAGPSGLALTDDGTLFIADTFNGRIRMVDPMTSLIWTAVGDGGGYRYQGPAEPPSASLARPSGITLDRKGNLFITDSDNHLIRRWDRATGKLDRLAGTGVPHYVGDGGSALKAGLNYPFGIVLDAEGRLLIADTFNHRIRELVV